MLNRNINISIMWLKGYKAVQIASIVSVTPPRVRQIAMNTIRRETAVTNANKFTKRLQFMPYKNRLIAELLNKQEALHKEKE